MRYPTTVNVLLDSKGRIPVPKPLRLELGLIPGQSLEFWSAERRLEAHIRPIPMDLVLRDGSLVAVPQIKLPTLTANMVRGVMESRHA
jgi:bifunctional DNA-binding transcriptional regulator/antitoxin component of YhaV-PrlF toxin-antitoxin module